MARTDLSVQQMSQSGITPSYTAAIADGHMFYNGEATFIHIKNTGTEKTLTIQTPGSVDGLAIADRTVTIPATTGDKMIGPFRAGVYNQISGADKGKIYIDYSSETAVTVAILRA